MRIALHVVCSVDHAGGWSSSGRECMYFELSTLGSLRSHASSPRSSIWAVEECNGFVICKGVLTWRVWAGKQPWLSKVGT